MQVLRHQDRNSMPREEEHFLRKMIRKDVLEIIKLENQQDGNDSDSDYRDDDRKLEDKVQYGTDSQSDMDEMLNNLQLPVIRDTNEYDDSEDMSYDGSELEFDSRDGPEEGGIDGDSGKTPQYGS